MTDPTTLQQLRALRERLAVQNSLSDRVSALSFEHYLNQVIINSAPEPARFAEIAEPWQWDQARTVGPAVEAVCRVRKSYKGPRAFWRTMPRGHDKSSSIGRLMNWALAYTARYFSAVVAASDREQAAFILEFMQAEARLNPWLAKRLDFKINKVVGRNGSTLKILAADAYGSFGLANDIIILDEVTHWSNGDLWNTIMSGSEKRPGSVILIITNAGMMGSWQWQVREVARTSKNWHLYEAPGPLAKWMSSERSKDMIRMLPPAVVKRVILNKWVDPAEDCGFITRAEAEACAERGRFKGLKRNIQGHQDVDYVAGIDYGPKKDRTVLTIGHRFNEEFHVDDMVVWEGKNFPGGTVPIQQVEDWIDKTRQTFPKCVFVVDPYQMEGTIQKFQGVTNIERFEPRAGKANYEMAQALRSAVVNSRLAWYPGCGDMIAPSDAGILSTHTLSDEFADLIIQTTAAGYRLNHIPGKHDDRVCSLGMCVWRSLGGFRRRSFVLHAGYF